MNLRQNKNKTQYKTLLDKIDDIVTKTNSFSNFRLYIDDCVDDTGMSKHRVLDCVMSKYGESLYKAIQDIAQSYESLTFAEKMMIEEDHVTLKDKEFIECYNETMDICKEILSVLKGSLLNESSINDDGPEKEPDNNK